jgi:hypothetical protein
MAPELDLKKVTYYLIYRVTDWQALKKLLVGDNPKQKIILEIFNRQKLGKNKIQQ